ncbi:MAG: hypothetical protein H7834_10650 [Magnetococcus sp. YQC-9]
MFAGLFCKRRKTIPQALARAAHFLAKGAKNASFEERAKSQSQNPGRGISQTRSFFLTVKTTHFKLGAGYTTPFLAPN